MRTISLENRFGSRKDIQLLLFGFRYYCRWIFRILEIIENELDRL